MRLARFLSLCLRVSHLDIEACRCSPQPCLSLCVAPPGSPDPAAALTIPRQPVEPFATAGIPISSGPIGPTVVSGGMFSTARRSQGNNSSASLSPAQHEIHRAAHDTYTGPCPAVRGRGGVRGGLRRVQHTFRPGNTHGSSATMHNDDSSDSQAEEADRSTAYESEEDMPITTAGTRR